MHDHSYGSIFLRNHIRCTDTEGVVVLVHRRQEPHVSPLSPPPPTTTTTTTLTTRDGLRVLKTASAAVREEVEHEQYYAPR